MKLTYAVLFAAMTLAAEEKPAPKYVVHWTSEVRNQGMVAAVACSPGVPDCGAVYFTEDHWSALATKDEVATFVRDLVDYKTVMVYASSGFTGFSTVPSMNPRIVAIYELKPVPAKITEERIETPMPPQVEIRQKVVLP